MNPTLLLLVAALFCAAAGPLLNHLVMVRNGGYMPVRADTLRVRRKLVRSALHRAATPHSRMRWAADVIELPLQRLVLGYGRVSVGDLLLLAGSAIAIGCLIALDPSLR